MPEWLASILEKRKLPIHWVWIYVDIRTAKECWPWTGSRRDGPDNYGRFRYKGKARLTHRVVYALCNELSIEEFEETGWLVRHKCDFPLCCNPAHLTAGTHAENMKDKRDRCRFLGIRRGEEVNTNKLKVRQVLAIRRALSAGTSSKKLGAKYGVHENTIEAIRTGKNWKWLSKGEQHA